MANGEEKLGSLGETLIPIVNKLQEILHGANLPTDCKVELPEVAVVGSQSSGKSSVLESLVGRDFLPRGPGICTRRPLVLHLRRTEEEQEWAEFHAHLPGRKFTDFAAVRREIDAETARLLGNSDKDVSDKPIYLTIFSPNVLTMSLIDLPGMTRVPVKGQPDNIASKVEGLIMRYIRNPSCIILAVSAANADLANSDALALARTVDPDGRRTIGVLTKLDIMDRGTDAMAMLRNETLPLRLGYVAVVNRSQHDIQSATPVAQARAREVEFFRSHARYGAIAAQCGIVALSKRIKSILVEHIKQRLPELRSEVALREKQKREELAALGSTLSDTSNETLREALLRLLNTYAGSFSDGLQGRRAAHLADMCALRGGARIRHVFQHIYGGSLDRLDPCCSMTDDQIWATMNNCAGVGRDLILSKEAFEVLVRASMDQLHNPGMQCLSLVMKELLRLAEDCTPPELARYPALEEELSGLVRGFITAAVVRAEAMLDSLFECELAYINVDHPAFIGIQAAWQEHVGARNALRAALEEDGGGTGGLHSPSHGGPPAMPAGGHRRTVPQARHHAAVRRESDQRRLMMTTSISDSPAHSASMPSLGEDPASARDGDEDSSGWFSFFRRNDHHGAAGEGQPHPAQSTLAVEGFGSVIATSRPAQVLAGPNLPSPPSVLVSKIKSEGERDAVLVMRKMVASYFSIVRGTMKDLVPKVVMKFVVLHTEGAIHAHLIAHLLRGEERELMAERPDVAARRRVVSESLSVLRQALDQLRLLPSELEAQAEGDTVPAAHAHTWSPPQARGSGGARGRPPPPRVMTDIYSGVNISRALSVNVDRALAAESSNEHLGQGARLS